jgi:DNA-binding NarL/FixJ family response regulator
MTDHEIAKLTPRQQEVLDLMCQGMPTKLISKKLHLSAHTVAEYRHVILQRLGAANVVELVNKINRIRAESRLEENPDLRLALDTPPKLLVVEDDHCYREQVVSELQQAGFPCRGVSCLTEMESALNQLAADIVLLDLNLGEEDGLEMASLLRASHRCGIIMMTTRGMVEQRIDGLAMGADAYLVKPVDMRELIGVIRNLHRRQVEWRYDQG